MPDLLTQFLNWVLYARVQGYWSSHASANILVAIPTVLLILKVWHTRWHGQLTKHLVWWLFIPAIFFDAAVAGLLPGSLHEVLFEVYFVMTTLLWQTVPLSAYVYEWVNNVHVWASWCIMWSFVTVCGLVWFRKEWMVRLLWWAPFIAVDVVWAAIALPVSLPFPTTGFANPWCHDCFVPNFFEFMYNLTFTIGFMGMFDLFAWTLSMTRRLMPEGKLLSRFLLGSAAGVAAGVVAYQFLQGQFSGSEANLMGYGIGFFVNYAVQRLTKTVRH